MAASDSHGTIRAQSAMEYLATYGWALLLIAVALAVLLYYGVVNPSFFVGQQCFLPAGLTCAILGMNTNGMILVNIYQSLGPSINITAIGCSSAPSFANIPAYTGNQIVLHSGSNKTFQVQCYSGSSALSSSIGSAFMGYLLINYTQPFVSGFQHTASGKILAKPSTLLLATSVLPLDCFLWSNFYCITQSGFYLWSGSWVSQTAYGTPPGTAAGSPLSCVVNPNLFCVTSTGTYEAAGSWVPQTSYGTPPGTTASSPLDCYINTYFYCMTPNGEYEFSGGSWVYQSMPAPPGA